MPVSEPGTDRENDPDLSPDTFSRVPPTKTARISRRLPGGRVISFDAAYAVVDGRAIHQGDILLGDAAEVEQREQRRKAAERYWALVVASAGEKWPGGVLPYVADPAIAGLVAKAAAVFSAKTRVRLRPRTNETDHVRFVAGATNEAAVGRQGGAQVVSLAPNCTLGTALHEICHALGLWHEQCRPDRDTYVEVIEANVLSGCVVQFDVVEDDAVKVGPYDYGSIMHYGAHDFADPPGAITIRTRNGAPIGQRSGLSAGDIAGLASLYP